MKLSDFDFKLPPERIAKTPCEPRDHSRLMVARAQSQSISHAHFYDLPQYLEPGDLVVMNNTKVLSARLFGKSPTRTFELLLLEPDSQNPLQWSCLVRPGKKIKQPTSLHFDDKVSGQVRRTDQGSFVIRFENIAPRDFYPWLERTGELPIPPYLDRQVQGEDSQWYQTVYAKHTGSIAAPTAGLHFTPELLEELGTKKVEIAEVTLHVGYGTFHPITCDTITDHQMHGEHYSVSEASYAKILKAQKNKKKIIPIGTTSLRTLESLPTLGLQATTRLFLHPGSKLSMAQGLVTNFHLPKTSLFVLVSTLLSPVFAQTCYQTAIDHQYRFYSYGDAMLILDPLA